MHPVARALQQTIIHARPPPPMRGFLIELSDQATMIGDLSGVVRAWRPEDPRFAETKIFTREAPQPPRLPKKITPPKQETTPWFAGACGFFGVLALSSPLLLHLFF
jgi:hypothetical protein